MAEYCCFTVKWLSGIRQRPGRLMCYMLALCCFTVVEQVDLKDSSSDVDSAGDTWLPACQGVTVSRSQLKGHVYCPAGKRHCPQAPSPLLS